MAQLLSTNKALKELKNGFHVLQTQLNSGFHKKKLVSFQKCQYFIFSAGHSKPYLT